MQKGSRRQNIILPLFDKDKCTQYFSKVFKSSKNHEFVLPSWIPHLPEPANSDFNINLPTCQEVTRVIRRMKAGKSPCPLDQVSVIVLKRCPYLRTFLTSIIEKVWQTKRIPSAWKAATTILINKKGEANDPGNFRPITLQPICQLPCSLFVLNPYYETAYSNLSRTTISSNVVYKRVSFRRFLVLSSTLHY